MIDIPAEIVTVIMLGGVLVGVLLGYHIAIPIGILSLVMGVLVFGPSGLNLVTSRFFELIHSNNLIAAPLFIFMGGMLERSGLADKMYDALNLWMRKLRGGLAIVTILLGTVLAASVGIVGASVTMLALIALPPMVKRGYDKGLASGAVCAGGTLGILIPPSIMLVIYGPMANISVGKLFFGAFIPGFILSALYIGYIAIRCIISPKMAPTAADDEEVEDVSLGQKTLMLVKSLIPPMLLLLSVLGVIFFGIASPTEASAAGAVAATLLTVAYGKFSIKTLYEVLIQTFKISSMILLIAGLGFAFVGVFLGAGCGSVISNAILAAPGGAWGAFFMIMIVVFILGIFIDWIGIIFIMVPIISPIATKLGFDPLWFGLMICINLQMSFLTPPMAHSIFYLRGAAPKEMNVKMNDIIRGILPFVGLIVLALVLCAIFPQIITWLPNMMIGK